MLLGIQINTTLKLLLSVDFTIIIWVYGWDEIFWNVFQINFKGVNRSLNSGVDKW